MPWKTSSVKEQRWGFVQKALRTTRGLAELCRRSGISRKTAYKWLARFSQRGRWGLGDQSHAARQLHNRPALKWLTRLRRGKREHAHWGAPKIHWWLGERFGRRGVPSEAAISRWLKQWGLTRPGRRRSRAGRAMVRGALTVARRANDVWTVDYKGWFRTGDGTKVEPLTVRDLASRYILGFILVPQQNMARTRQAMKEIFQVNGIPRVIRVDNGSPFGASGALGLTQLSAWWLRLGIKVEFTQPGHPEQNGAHEQMHRVYKMEALNPVAQSRKGQQRRTKRWCRRYNYERPHEGLGMAVPGDHYRKSRRKMPKLAGSWEYPSAWSSRWVKRNGMIGLDGRSRFVGEAFGKERVGLKRIAEGRWEVYFGTQLAGELYDADNGGIRAAVFQKKPVRKRRP
jgi:transposase InsO family protein